MRGAGDELAQARYQRLVRMLEERMRSKGLEAGDGCPCGYLLVERAEVEQLEQEGISVQRLRRAAQEAGHKLGWGAAAAHLDVVGRLSVYDASPVQDVELEGELPGLDAAFG